MKDTLIFILTQIVDHPEEILIDEVIEGDRTIFVVHANPEDMGKIIGKKGRIIMALRDLIKIIATKQKVFADIEIAENEKENEKEIVDVEQKEA
jgi:hypothetical protein